MQVIHITTSGHIYHTESTGVDPIRYIHQTVGGLADFTILTPTLYMWFNEDGRDLGLEPNGIATDIYSSVVGDTNVIVGDIVLTGPVADVSLDDLVKILMK